MRGLSKFLFPLRILDIDAHRSLSLHNIYFASGDDCVAKSNQLLTLSAHLAFQKKLLKMYHEEIADGILILKKVLNQIDIFRRFLS